jgi:hypothetical protein
MTTPTGSNGIAAAFAAATEAAAVSITKEALEALRLGKQWPMAPSAPMGCPVAWMPTAFTTPVAAATMPSPWFPPVQASGPTISCGWKAPDHGFSSDPSFQQELFGMLHRIEKHVQENAAASDGPKQIFQDRPRFSTAQSPTQAPLVTIHAPGLPIQNALHLASPAPAPRISDIAVGPGIDSPKPISTDDQRFGTLMNELTMVNDQLDSQARNMSVKNLVDGSGGASRVFRQLSATWG